jgi:hypothetical protein
LHILHDRLRQTIVSAAGSLTSSLAGDDTHSDWDSNNHYSQQQRQLQQQQQQQYQASGSHHPANSFAHTQDAFGHLDGQVQPPFLSTLSTSIQANTQAAGDRLRGLLGRMRTALTATSTPILRSVEQLQDRLQEQTQANTQALAAQFSQWTTANRQEPNGVGVAGAPLPSALPQQSRWINSKEPSIEIIGESVVLVLKPREFARLVLQCTDICRSVWLERHDYCVMRRKRLEFIKGGAANMQVFSDFENVFTRARSDISGGQCSLLLHTAYVHNCCYCNPDCFASPDKAMSTAELVESSGVLPPEVISLLAVATKRFQQQAESSNVSEDDDARIQAALTEFSLECQRIITQSGTMRLEHIPGLVRLVLNGMLVCFGMIVVIMLCVLWAVILLVTFHCEKVGSESCRH